MRKTEIKKATNHELIFETIETYAELICNYNLQRGTKQLQSHLEDLVPEMVKRELLTKEEGDYLLYA